MSDLRKQKKVLAEITNPGEIGVDPVGLKNIADSQIDPATEQKQDDIITKLGNESKFGDNSDKSSVAGSTSSVELVAADITRKQVLITNDTNKDMWFCYGTPAVVDTGTPLSSGGILIEDNYRGQITAIWSTGVTGNALIQDITE